MNAVTIRGASASLVASLSGLRQQLQSVQATIPTAGGDPYLRMLRDGSWVYGAENTEVEPGSLWAVNILGIKHGYVCWTDYDADPVTKKQPKNEKLGELLVGSALPKPLKTSLEDTGWPWADAMAVELVCVSGEDKGQQVDYVTSSTGGLNAFAKLVDAIQNRLALDEGLEAPVPLVELSSDHYQHSTWGKTYFPVFTIRGWAPLSDNLGDIDGEIEDARDAVAEAPAKAPAKRQRSTPAVQPKAAEPKATEELAQAIETKEERKARLLAEMEALDADEGDQSPSDKMAEQVRSAHKAETVAAPTEIRRRRRVA